MIVLHDSVFLYEISLSGNPYCCMIRFLLSSNTPLQFNFPSFLKISLSIQRYRAVLKNVCDVLCIFNITRPLREAKSPFAGWAHLAVVALAHTERYFSIKSSAYVWQSWPKET